MTASTAPSTATSGAPMPAKAPNAAKRASKAKKSPPVKAKTATAKKAAPVKARRATPSKVVKPAAPVKAAQTSAPTKGKNKKEVTSPAAKDKKVKVVRDSFTIPKTEFTRIAEMKKRAMTLGVEVKKSELIRAGLQLISGLQDTAFKKALASVPTLKTGRPAKD